ncbi:sigma factor G inhibitor Gin [Desulfosporosinus sp. SB140]|uniref:sigma factor G inhibitor Gin n=1 Tax=Desulfosporosinus paludis TaxID=3115649 RepID=UPI00388E6F57
MIKTSDTLKEHENPKKDKNQEIVASNGKLLPVCYRCAQVPKNGLYDGFRVRGMFFCSDCQRELYSAEQGSPEYQEFLFLIQGLLF